MELTTEQAKDFLESKGYYVRNLWTILDVQEAWECDNDEALDILDDALNSDSTFSTIRFNIDYYASERGLKEE